MRAYPNLKREIKAMTADEKAVLAKNVQADLAARLNGDRAARNALADRVDAAGHGGAAMMA
jgi:hypothetical protein